MAIEVEIGSAAALVTGEARERKLYEGTGDSRRITGRATDDSGRPLSVADAVVITDSLGLLGDAQVQLPDIQMTGLKPGMVIQLEGRLSVRLAGGDYGSIRSAVTAERLSPLGDYVEWTKAAMTQKPRPDAKAS